jgi:hypothetical protein
MRVLPERYMEATGIENHSWINWKKRKVSFLSFFHLDSTPSPAHLQPLGWPPSHPRGQLAPWSSRPAPKRPQNGIQSFFTFFHCLRKLSTAPPWPPECAAMTPGTTRSTGNYPN